MRIALIHTPLTSSTGGERQILHLALELSRQGHHVEIFTNDLDRKNCFPRLLKGVKINVIPPASGFLAAVTAFFRRCAGVEKSPGRFSILSIGKAIPPGRFDIINCHNPSSNWAAWLAKKRLKLPVVWMCNEPPFWHFMPQMRRRSTFIIDFLFYNLFDKHTAGCADEIVVLSRRFQEIVRKIYNRDSIVVKSGIDTAFFEEENGCNVRKELGLENSFVLLQVGSAANCKVDFSSILALSQLSREDDGLKLIFVGRGAREFYGPKARELGVADKVLFFDNVDDGRLAGFYSACDVFLFPANQSWGLAVTEAMSASRPVIVSESAGVSEIIRHGVNGFVVEHANPGHIAHYVKMLMNNPRLREDLGENAHDFVKKNFSWQKYARDMLDIFEKTLQGYEEKQKEAS